MHTKLLFQLKMASQFAMANMAVTLRDLVLNDSERQLISCLGGSFLRWMGGLFFYLFFDSFGILFKCTSHEEVNFHGQTNNRLLL